MVRSRPLVAALLLIATSCSATPPVGPPQVTIPESGFDLEDPDLQGILGSPVVTDIAWRRQAGGLEVVGRGIVPDPEEIDLIAAVVSDIPEAIWDHSPVRTIIRSPGTPGDRLPHELPVAYARGPDVYLLDRAFELTQDGSTRYDLARALIHELVHVAQFFTMSDEYIAAALGGATDTVDPTVGSSTVIDFAETTGWQRSGPGWTLPDSAPAASSYGRTSPGEDMAEAVTLVAVGLANLVPEDRVTWVERWLDTDADELARGRPWAPDGSEQVRADQAIYDQDAVAELLTTGRERVEPLYFAVPADTGPADALAQEITAQLLQRGFVGTLAPIDDHRLPRVGGAFAGPGGVKWWVELWDFRLRHAGTDGPDTPLLTYVAVW